MLLDKIVNRSSTLSTYVHQPWQLDVILISGVDHPRWKVKQCHASLKSRMYSVIILLSIGGLVAELHVHIYRGLLCTGGVMLGLATTSILVIARSQVYGCLLEQGLGGQCSQCAPSLASLLSTEVRPVLRMVEVRLALGLFCNCMEGGKGGKKEKYHSDAPLPPVHNSWKSILHLIPTAVAPKKTVLRMSVPRRLPLST